MVKSEDIASKEIFVKCAVECKIETMMEYIIDLLRVRKLSKNVHDFMLCDSFCFLFFRIAATIYPVYFNVHRSSTHARVSKPSPGSGYFRCVVQRSNVIVHADHVNSIQTHFHNTKIITFSFWTDSFDAGITVTFMRSHLPRTRKCSYCESKFNDGNRWDENRIM